MAVKSVQMQKQDVATKIDHIDEVSTAVLHTALISSHSSSIASRLRLLGGSRRQRGW